MIASAVEVTVACQAVNLSGVLLLRLIAASPVSFLASAEQSSTAHRAPATAANSARVTGRGDQQRKNGRSSSSFSPGSGGPAAGERADGADHGDHTIERGGWERDHRPYS
jgi:hypothetical protein